MHLPFRVTASITVISSQNIQHSLRLYAILSLLSGHPFMMHSSVTVIDFIGLFHAVIHVSSYILGCLWMFLCCLYSLTYLLFLQPCLPYGYVWITNLP